MVVLIKGEIEIRLVERQGLTMGGKVCQASDRALMDNERSLAKNMPLLSEFTRYGIGRSRKRRAKMLYRRPISNGVEYLINNLEGNKSSLADKNAGGFLKQKANSKVEENEKSLLEGTEFGVISYEWMFRILRNKYHGPEGRQ